MRTLAMALVLAASPALAEVKPRMGDAPVTVRPETIIIHGKAPPKVAPKPKKRYHRIAPPYSDQAIESNVWAKAWVMLDIDTRGTVQRIKLLKRPGYDLDQIAIDRAFAMRFEPAEDANGYATRSQLVVPIEWPSYWWLVELEGVSTGIPAYAHRIRCAGSGPMALDSIHPTYRDCSQPDLSKVESEPWITRR